MTRESDLWLAAETLWISGQAEEVGGLEVTNFFSRPLVDVESPRRLCDLK